MFSHTLSVICFLYYQATVYLCLLPYVGQSAGTALDVKAWQGVLYSLLTKAPCQAFTSKTRSMRVCPAQGVYLGLCFICERNIIGKRCVSVKGQVLAAPLDLSGEPLLISGKVQGCFLLIINGGVS